MASEKAVESAKGFCGPAMYAASAMHARITLTDVPPSADGLRLLASNGNWSEVLALAERLATEVAAKARRHPFKYASVPWSTSPPESTLRVSPEHPQEEPLTTQSPPETDVTAAASSASRFSTDAAVRSARLPYVLVQVTANLKMRRIAAAKKVVDALGDIEGEGFRHPVTRESFAPFSLRVVAALLPLYVGAPMEAQKKLYALLEECLRHERQCGAANSQARISAAVGADAVEHSAASAALQRTWTRRVLRVQRALLHVHIHMNQQSLAHSLAEQVLRSEEIWHHKFHDLSDELHQLRHALHLQQLFCLALHIGDASRAHATHAAIQKIAAANGADSSTEATPSNVVSNANLCKLVVLSCDAFMAVFRGEFREAVRLFRDVIDAAADMKQALRAAADGSGTDVHSSPVSDDCISEDALRRWVLQDICANAQVSHATCQAYCSDADPTKLMSSLCTTLEGYAKAEPHVLCNSDAFVESLVRFYTLSGDRKANLNRLADLLEVFRCDRMSLPNLEALV
ncbi:hypothetical protein, conserved [Leishmania donovani]|uniref:Uncharacterized protein n=1 Tax=Leishmania donovani TaxID=5661 RepID=A0A3S7X019_LEIDO|nr:hypothetical protein, conserved [Leishmania donovani]AYU79773.1 hypothetical protein LdCL_260022900 [Leishmania donovani]TPP41204.1 hypothetical protein CGC21_32175 [Leishmania donovani]CBZ35061.1 hypothetical protein, conserved [Leishmania donovani]